VSSGPSLVLDVGGRAAPSVCDVRSLIAGLLDAERSGPRRDVVLVGIDGLSDELARSCWGPRPVRTLRSVVPTTSAAAWLSSLSGTGVAGHGVPGVVFDASGGVAPPVNVYDPRAEFGIGVDGNVFTDAARCGWDPRAVLGDLEITPGVWRDALLRGAEGIEGHRFYTTGEPSYRSRPAAEVLADVDRAVARALASDGTPVFLWCFIELDRHVHHHGYDDEARAFVDGFGQWAERLATRGDIVVAAHSDHGLVPTTHDPELAAVLDALAATHGFHIGGAGRVRWLHPAGGRRFPGSEVLRSALPPSVDVLDSDLVLSPGSRARERIGPVSLVARTERFLADPAHHFDHGGWSEAELCTPWCVWDGTEPASG
jgi:hypothetical protein